MSVIERYICAEGRVLTRRAVTAGPGCDDFFHDDGSLCRHIKAAPPANPGGAIEALRAIAIYAAPPHPEPCGTDACLLCLIEGTAQNAIPGGQ